jgi:Asp-tRNA(Asn)/Glu-tRNA(Gln) amidotransferase A subunit family amidase
VTWRALQDRIGNDNYVGLYLRAVGETAPYESVMAIAKAFDDERANGTVRSGLHGIPMLFKVSMLQLSQMTLLTIAI